MLSIGKLVVGQQRYYDQQVAQGHDDYYSGRGEAPGEWVGHGAKALGLDGVVHAAQFDALLSGTDPRDLQTKLQGWRPSKVAALDLTFSAPKSVSVLFAVADEPVACELVAAHESSVRAALVWIEDTSVEVRRGSGGQETFLAEGLIAAAYRHRMSRALDPQLHTHVVAANMAKGPDGRFTALNGTPLYRSAKTAGYLYQAHLRAEVSERLGLEWGPVKKGAAELQAIPKDVLEEFSKRRHEMQRAAEEGGFSLRSKRSAEAAAVDTRERKQYGVDTHTWREEVQARAAEHGLDREAVGRLLSQGKDRAGVSSVDAESDGGLEDRLAGEHGLTERANTFDDRAVLQQFAGAAEQGARVPAVRSLAQGFNLRADVLPTLHGEMTTSDLVATEERLIRAAVGRAKTGTASLNKARIDEMVSRADRQLTADQRDVVISVATSGNGVDVVEALAGTGKTYTAGVIRQAYESAGYDVLGLAPTGRGARELSDEAGIPARTIDRALIDIEQNARPIPANAVIVIDEAGMAPTRITARLLEHADTAGAKVIAIGDSGQLPSVLAGGWLKAVGQRVGEVRLTEVMRQRDPGERCALGALHAGAPERFLTWAETAGRVNVLDPSELRDHAIRAWVDAIADLGPRDAVMISRDNETRDHLNVAARAHRTANGELSDEHAFGPVAVAVGDRIICRDNDARVGVDNGTRGTVRRVASDAIVLETDGGLYRDLPAAYVADHVEHAYCLTGHGMQGGTVERAIVVASPTDLTRGWSYSALSRARGETKLLIADEQRHYDGRAEVAPDPGLGARDRASVLAAVARRMLVRDDEDLAVVQLAPSGREDDRKLVAGRAAGHPVAQERGAARLEAVEPPVSFKRLLNLRDQIGHMQMSLTVLPLRSIGRLDELDVQIREVTDRLADHETRIEAVPAPTQKFGRSHDGHAQEREFLAKAIAMDHQELDDLRGSRVHLELELGDPSQVISERDGLQTALTDLQKDYVQIRDELVGRVLDQHPAWLRDALGDRPQSRTERDMWDRAARDVTVFRINHDVIDDKSVLGPKSAHDRDAQREWQRADDSLQRAQRQLGRAVGPRHRDVELGIE
ncbi:MobF family relaxase [Conexibacter sp. DBS9H8]|uniref:MobF family relaxase n=1 Tax=Conexibacter sp. DBS9H8 TaxID=2937801 RepID=UPI00200BD92A|nr:MobF family relaxase [Conexibacter sp. DBS9H8]